MWSRFHSPCGVRCAGSRGDLPKGPYLISPDDNTRMTVLWQADSTPANSFVEWGPTTAYGSTSGALAESGGGADEHQFEHTITGLTAGTRYYYRVDVDGNREIGSFLAGAGAAQTAVTIYAYGDTRANPDDHDVVCAALLKDVDDAPDWQSSEVASWSFIWRSSEVANGDCVITVRVTDDSGLTTDELLTVTVANEIGLLGAADAPPARPSPAGVASPNHS